MIIMEGNPAILSGIKIAQIFPGRNFVTHPNPKNPHINNDIAGGPQSLQMFVM